MPMPTSPFARKGRALLPGQQSELTVINADGRGRDVIFTADEVIAAPNWHPGGDVLVFNSERDAKQPGHAQCYRMRPDGGGIEQLTHDERVNWFPHPSPDGTQVVYISFPPGTLGHPEHKDVQLKIMPPDGGSH